MCFPHPLRRRTFRSALPRTSGFSACSLLPLPFKGSLACTRLLVVVTYRPNRSFRRRRIPVALGARPQLAVLIHDFAVILTLRANRLAFLYPLRLLPAQRQAVDVFNCAYPAIATHLLLLVLSP